MEQHTKTYAELPVHPMPESVRGRTGDPLLVIDGLVTQPRGLTASNLNRLPTVELAGRFECEEGWSVPNLAWTGWRLADVLALASPLPDARWVRVLSGEYAVPLPLPDCQSGLLAQQLGGQPLAREQGGPWRLVVPDGSCFTSVKWVERLELTAEPGEESGRAIARDRLSRGQGYTR